MSKTCLSGITVIDLTSVILGPFCTQMLGDLGADVVKVESPQGDVMRNAGPMRSDGMGPIYLTINRNKRSICLDLTKADAKKVLTRLIGTADVVIHNIRAKAIEKLGFGYEAVKQIKPDIVYVHAVGFASGGHYEGRQAYDDLVQAVTGMASMPPLLDGDENPRYFPGLVADKTTGIFATNAVLAGLLHKERSGEGQFIEVPMFECMIAFNMAENLYGHTFQPAIGQTAYARSANLNRRPYKTKDGYIALMPYSDENWRQFFSLSGEADLINDERFSTYKERTRNIETLYGMMKTFMLRRSTDDWLECLFEAKVPAMPVHTLESVLSDPQLTETGFLEKRQHPSEGEYLAINNPITYNGERTPIRIEPRKLGEDNIEILSEAGFSEEEIIAFSASGALK